MSTTTPTSAAHNGHAWGLRARDWSETESQMRPSYELAITMRGVPPAIGSPVAASTRSATATCSTPLPSIAPVA